MLAGEVNVHAMLSKMNIYYCCRLLVYNTSQSVIKLRIVSASVIHIVVHVEQ